MIARLPGQGRDLPAPLVLIADEDPSVLELLTLALKAHHIRVSVVQDGDEALRRARLERPDLVIADVRLPKRGGLELCQMLRREIEQGDVPVLLLSTANNTEARVEALAHGADEFVGKPFSPKELVARVQRLLTRSRDADRHRRRNAELERDLGRLRGEASRARAEADHERSLRSLTDDMFGELVRTLDVDELDARLLREVCWRTGARSAVLLAPDGRGDLVPAQVRGDLPERWANFSLPAAGTCAEWLSATGRPLRREELERLPEAPEEVARLATHGVALLAALAGRDGLEGVVAGEDRPDGASFTRAECDALAALCAAAAPARVTARRFRAQQDRALALLGASASTDPRRSDIVREARARLDAAAGELELSPGDRTLLEQALDVGPRGWTPPGRAALASLLHDDPTQRIRRLCELFANAEACAVGDPGAGEDPLALLTASGLRYQSLRLSGRSPFESWRTASAWLGIPGDRVLRATFPEGIEPAH